MVKSSIVAQGLQIKRLVPAYSKIRRIDSEDLKTGVCFASGGSGIDDLTSRTLVKEEKNLIVISINTIIYLKQCFLIIIFFIYFWMVVGGLSESFIDR